MGQNKWLLGLVNSSLANFHGQYNFQSIAIALVIMRDVYPQTGWEQSLLTSTAFFGAIHGQIIFGYIGDWIGRHRAMVAVNSLCALAVVVSATLSMGTASHVYLVVVVARFFVGVGVGGVYPLSAVTVAEGTASPVDRRKQVAWGFLFQVPGSAMPFLVAYLAMRAFPDNPEVQFRLVLGLGAVVPAVVAALATRLQDSREFVVARKGASQYDDPIWRSCHIKKLVGTGGGWFCYDIVHYGPYLLAPVIVGDIFARQDAQGGGLGEEVSDVAWQSAFANGIGVFGVLSSIFLFRYLTTRQQQVYGFLLIAVSFFLFGGMYNTASNTTLFLLFCVMTFAINSGPSVTTYVLPSETFPPEVRSTFNGASAAIGKVGATLVTMADYYTYRRFSVPSVLYVYGAVALLGALVTVLWVEDPSVRHLSLTPRALSEEQRAIKQTAAKYTEFI